MRIINRTIYGSAVQTALFFNLPLEIKQFTTLNEKFNILEAATIPEGDIPTIKYFCIGNGGHTVINGADGIAYTTPLNHGSADAALFNHLPFVLRTLDNDLTVSERARYGLRKEIVVDSVTYVAYYLKRLDLTNVSQRLQHVNVTDGVETVTEFLPDADNLSPTPPILPNGDVITTDGNYLATSSILTIDFTDADVNELINVSNILYGSPDRAIVSEIGLCSGLDIPHSVEVSGGVLNYSEAMAVQIATFITGYYPVGYSNRGFELSIEAGATEPLLNTGSTAVG